MFLCLTHEYAPVNYVPLLGCYFHNFKDLYVMKLAVFTR